MLDRILRSSWKAISPTSLSQASCFDSGDNRGGQSGQWLWPDLQGQDLLALEVSMGSGGDPNLVLTSRAVGELAALAVG